MARPRGGTNFFGGHRTHGAFATAERARRRRNMDKILGHVGPRVPKSVKQTHRKTSKRRYRFGL